MEKTLLYLILFLFCLNLEAQVFSENFDNETIGSTTFTNWSSIDMDDDGETWKVFDAESNLVDLNNDGTFDVPMNWDLTGNAVESRSYDPNLGSLEPDNFLITTNPIDLSNVSGTTISFKLATYQLNDNYIADYYSVYLTTTNNVSEIINQTPITSRLISDDVVPDAPDGSDSFGTIVLDASSYDGEMVYLTFRHHNCSDNNAIILDDIIVDGDLSAKKELFDSFNYYMNAETLFLSSSSQMNELRIFTIMGNQVKSFDLSSNKESVNISELASGIYLAQININNLTKTFKFIKK